MGVFDYLARIARIAATLRPLATPPAGNLFTIDVHHARFGGGGSYRPAQWAALAREGGPRGLVGVILKCGQGVTKGGQTWFRGELGRAQAAFRHVGCYWWLETLEGAPTARDQAEAYLRNMARAGGLRRDDIHPCVDVEHENGTQTRERTEAMTREFIAIVSSKLGRPVGLYAKSLWMDLGIKGLLGAGFNWTAGYSERMSSRLGQIGIAREQVLLWQYTNGSTNQTTFPTSFSPTFGAHDANVFLGRSLAESTSYSAFRRLLTSGAPDRATELVAAVGVATVLGALGR